MSRTVLVVDDDLMVLDVLAGSGAPCAISRFLSPRGSQELYQALIAHAPCPSPRFDALSSKRSAVRTKARWLRA
jgi:hypothetical protein